jgi:hypothetical protein
MRQPTTRTGPEVSVKRLIRYTLGIAMASGETLDAGDLAARISQRIHTVDRDAWDIALNGLRNGRRAALPPPTPA